MQDLWSPLFLPKEGTQRCVLTSPDTIWGEKQTGEKQHESFSISLLLLGLLICEIGQKGEHQAFKVPLNQGGIEEGVFLDSKQPGRMEDPIKNFAITWLSSSGHEGSWQTPLHCLSVQVSKCRVQFSQGFSTSLQLQCTSKVPAKDMVRAQQSQRKSDFPTRAVPSSFSRRVLCVAVLLFGMKLNSSCR